MTMSQDQSLLKWDNNRAQWEAKHADRMQRIITEDDRAQAEKQAGLKQIIAMREVCVHSITLVLVVWLDAPT